MIPKERTAGGMQALRLAIFTPKSANYSLAIPSKNIKDIFVRQPLQIIEGQTLKL